MSENLSPQSIVEWASEWVPEANRARFAEALKRELALNAPASSDMARVVAERDQLKRALSRQIELNTPESATSALKWQRRSESYTPSEHGHQIWPTAAPFTIAYLATDHCWYTLDVPVPVLGNVARSEGAAK